MSWNERLLMKREQMREYDRIAIEELGIPGPVLMENAGRGAYEMALEMLDCRRRVAVLAGPGNNGGDGFVVARHLMIRGLDVSIFVAVPTDKIRGDARLNLDVLRAADPSLEIEPVLDGEQLERLPARLSEHDLVVDALLGTGVSRNVEGHLADVIDAINSCKTPVLSVDIPSGLDADSGSPWGTAVRARGTATFGHLKRGLAIHPGVELAGRVRVVSIGVPAPVSERAGHDAELLGEEALRHLVPARPARSHKGTYGHLLLLSGSLGKTGAAALAGRAALRAGTGLVTVATTAAAQPVLEARCPAELMTESVIERTDAPLSDKLPERLARALAGKQALAVGPGLTTAPGISSLVIRLLHDSGVPAVVDADGINILAADPAAAGRITTPMIFTPHPGEMARLMDKTVPAIQADRVEAAREAARWHKVIVALKGARTAVAAPDGRVWINPTGNPGMATGGMGDVLTGVIGGLLAQGLSPLDATLLGVYIHGLAGDCAAATRGEPGLVASDAIDELPAILRRWSVTPE